MRLCKNCNTTYTANPYWGNTCPQCGSGDSEDADVPILPEGWANTEPIPEELKSWYSKIIKSGVIK